MDKTDEESIALETIELLEARLQRVEFFVKGTDDHQGFEQIAIQGKEHSIQRRLQRLEQSLQKLASKSRVVRDTLDLCETIPHAQR